MKEKPTKGMRFSALHLAAAITLFVAADAMAAKGPQPSICTRSCWGARSASSSQMSGLSRAIIHHTAGNEYNTTGLTASKSYVRAIQNLHMNSRGWSDIAYHFLTDKYGNLFEGRVGSMSGLPRGAHDGYNYNSFGFNIMGYYHTPYNNTLTTASKNAIEAVIAWRMPSTWSANGSGTYNGNTVGTLDGHYKVKSTACPGSKIIPSIPAIRTGVTSRKNGGSTPSGPSGLTATVYSSSRINLAWVDNSGIEQGFKIERSLSSGSGFTQIATVGANVRSYASTGLASGTRYYYRVRAYNATGNSPYSNTANAVTKDTIPAAPSTLTATALSDTQIRLNWAQAMANEDGFRIFRSTDNVTFTQVATVGINVVTYTSTGLVGNRLYYFRVCAYNTAGNSAMSNTASDTTAPHAPTALTVTAVSGAANWNKLNLAWTDTSNAEVGFKVERGTAAAGPFTQIATTAAGVATYQDSGLAATTTYYYRVRSYNANGNSAYSAVVSRATPNAPPLLGAIGDKTVASGTALTFTATASDPNAVSTTTTWQNFTSFAHNTPNETVLFKRPSNSASTSQFLTTATNYTRVVSNGPSVWGSGNKSLVAGWTFNTLANPWIRLNTFNTATNPNPTIALDQRLQFKVYASKAVKIGLGIRETGTTAAYGANGGTTGAIEWVGVTNVASSVPFPNRLIAAATSTTVNFNIPFESQKAFTGDGIVPQNNVKGVLEHVIVKGEGGSGAYSVFFDDFQVVASNNNAYTLDAGAPAGASIGYRTGKFTWTPTTAQVGTHTITVRVTDRLGGVDTETITVTVTGTGNAAPVLSAIGAKTVSELSTLSFTAAATDANAGQVLTFSLGAGAPAGASITSAGAFTWTPTEAQGPGSYPVTVIVTDNGSPVATDSETITVTVNEANTAPVIAAIANQTVDEGSALSVSASATDSDLPAQSISYSLINAPAGMAINATSGLISWTPGESDGPGVDQVTVRATDNGNPALSSTLSFTVTVNEGNVAPVVTTPATSTKINTIARFDDNDDEPNGVVMFRQPSFSSTSTPFLDAAPNTTLVVTSPSFPLPDDNTSLKVVHANFSFKTGTVNPWLRLTTHTMNTNHAHVPNPTIPLNSKLRFKVYTDKSIKLAIAVRETGFNAPTGFNGGITGATEYVGVSGKQANGCPIPTRTIGAGTWTTVEFNLPSEPCASFVGGNGLLAAGKGTLEQVAVVPNGGMGAYNVYFDDFEVVETSSTFTVDTLATITFQASATDSDRGDGGAPQTLTFSLDAGAPTNAEIDEITGVFSWTPTAEQSPSTNVITIRATDDGVPAASGTKNVTIIVNKVNTVPYFGNIPDEQTFLGNGEVFSWDMDAGDDDMPGDTLSFTLLAKPTGATIDSAGVISWTAPASGSSTNTFTVRVQDNGSPVLFADETFYVIVSPANTAPVLNLGAARITEAVVNFETFTNGTPNEQVMFRKPAYSSTTTNHIDVAVANSTTVTTTFPAGNANAGSKVLRADWSFKATAVDYWVRLTTTDTAFLPNPVINASARLKFDIYTTKALKVGVGIREVNTTAENGANGGITGNIEYVGVGSQIGATPVPTRTVNAGTWTTLEFDLPNEPMQTLTGDSILAAGQQVLEHLILKGEGGTGAYTVYVDNFQVVEVVPTLNSHEELGLVEINVKAGSTLTFTASATDTDAVTYSLETGAPVGASLNSASGAFIWTPSVGDVGSSANIGVSVQDNPTNGGARKQDSDEFVVNVLADAVGTQNPTVNGAVSAGEAVVLTWDAIIGATYSVQAKGADGVWTTVQTVVADSATESVEVSSSEDRTYRVVEVSGSGSND